MRKLLLGLLLSTSVFAQDLSNPQRAQIHNPNLVSNGGVEKGTVGWSCSGGTCSQDSVIYRAGGKKSFKWDPSANAQTINFPTFAVSDNGDGNCGASTFYKGGGTSNITLAVYEVGNANPVSNSHVISQAATSWKQVLFNFPCSASPAASYRIVGTASGNAAQINFDDYFGGLPTNIGTVQQAQAILYAHRNGSNQTGINTNASAVKIAFNSVASPGYDSYSVFNTSTNRFVAPVTAKYDLSASLGFQGANVLNSRYFLYFVINGSTESCRGDDNIATAAAIFSRSVDCTVNLSQDDYVEVFFYGSGNNSSSTLTLDGAAAVSYFNVKMFPAASQVISSTQQQLPTTTLLTSGTSYTTPTGAVYLKVRAIGGGGGGAGSGAAATGGSGGAGGTTTFGSVLSCTGGGGGAYSGNLLSAGGSCTISSPAYGFPINGAAGGSGSSNAAAFALGSFGASSPFAGGGGSGVNTVTGGAALANSGAGGGGAGSGGIAVNSGGGGAAGGFAEFIIPNPASSYTYAIGSSGSAGAAGTSGLVGGAGGSGRIEITAYYSTGTPFLIGSVSTPSAGIESIRRAKVNGNCTASPCTITSQSGSWLSSITRASTGLYTANFSSTLSSDTTCVVNCFDSNNPTTNGCSAALSNNTTILQFLTKRTDNTTVDSAFSIICMGPN